MAGRSYPEAVLIEAALWRTAPVGTTNGLTDTVHRFRFERIHRAMALPFGVRPATTGVQVGDDDFSARFGPWRVQAEKAKISRMQITGPYRLIETAGPAQLTFADRGPTMATNGRKGIPKWGGDALFWALAIGVTLRTTGV